MTEVTTQPTSQDHAVEFDDANLYRVLKAIGVAFVVLVPVALLALPGVGIVAKLWIAFLAANLLVWTGVVALAVFAAVTRGVEAVRTQPQADASPEPALASAA
jgi:hypothetical protein